MPRTAQSHHPSYGRPRELFVLMLDGNGQVTGVSLPQSAGVDFGEDGTAWMGAHLHDVFPPATARIPVASEAEAHRDLLTGTYVSACGMRKGLFVFSVNVVSLREQPATQVAYFAYARPMADPRVQGANGNEWGPRCASQHRPELLQRVTGDLSHDINNALFVVMGMLESLEDEFSQVDGLQASIVQVMNSAQRAANLNANIGRLTTGARRNYLAVELDALLTAVVPRMTAMLPASLAPRLHWNAPGARVLCSAGEIEEIVLQLLLNAMEAVGSARGTVELSTEARNTGSCDWVCLSVRDSGSGIRAETQGMVFEPFYSTKGKPGLGLTIVRVLTKSLGGRVEVRSGNGLGTEVVVHLPVHTPAEARETEETPAPARSALAHGVTGGHR